MEAFIDPNENDITPFKPYFLILENIKNMALNDQENEIKEKDTVYNL